MQMTVQQVVFIILGVITLGAALLMVTRRNVFHAALFMMLSFFGVAGLYVLLEAPFLAAVQLFIYIGAISIMIIFAIMVTRGMMNPNIRRANRQRGAAALAAVALCGVLVWMALSHRWAVVPGPVPQRTIAILGATLVGPEGFVIPFETASVLLLIALIGAVTIARE
jgi:NADH-quinone oxidoreductase subunit J